MEIYLLKGDQNEGPFSAEAVQAMCASGEISTTDYIWHADLPEWTMAENVFPPVERKTPPTPPIPLADLPQNSDEKNNPCGACGAENISGANFCSHCGKRIEIICKPLPVPPPVIDSSKVTARKSRAFPWRKTIEKHGVIKVVGGGFLILTLIGAAYTAATPPAKLPANPRPVHEMTAQEVESISHFDKRDTALFESKANDWALDDVKNGWDQGRIVGVPTKGELEEFAFRRWEVFKISDEGKQLQRTDMDMYSAKNCWMAEYERFFIRCLKPRVQDARENSKPAF